MGWDKQRFAQDLVGAIEDIRDRMRDPDADADLRFSDAWLRFYAALAARDDFAAEKSARVADAMCREWWRRSFHDNGRIYLDGSGDPSNTGSE